MTSASEILTYAKDLRRQQTEAEQRLWYFLRAHRYKDLKFKRQKPIGAYIVDFVCIDLGLIIELDGSQHALQIHYDSKRTTYLKEQGFCVLRFWSDEVFRDIEGVLMAIDNQIVLLSKNPPPGAGRSVIKMSGHIGNRNDRAHR